MFCHILMNFNSEIYLNSEFKIAPYRVFNTQIYLYYFMYLLLCNVFNFYPNKEIIFATVMEETFTIYHTE